MVFGLATEGLKSEKTMSWRLKHARARVVCGSCAPTFQPDPRWGSPEHHWRTAVSCAQNCLRAAGGRLTYGGLGPTLLRSRGWGTPQFRLQESLCSNAVFVFPSATAGNFTLQRSRACVISAMSFTKSTATAPARALAGGSFVSEEDQERLLL